MDGSPNNNVERWGPLALAIIAIVIALFLPGPKWQPLEFKADAAQIAQVLGSLFVVALVLERALSVINNLLFGIEKNIAETLMRSASVNIATLEAAAALTPERDIQAISDTRGELLDAGASLEAAIEQKGAVDTRRERLRLAVGFLVAALIAAVGVRTFSALFTVPADTSPQRPVFDFLDILLTAGLLAGGSNGIAAVIDAIRGIPTKPGTGIDQNARIIATRLRSFNKPTSMTITTPAVTINQVKP